MSFLRNCLCLGVIALVTSSLLAVVPARRAGSVAAPMGGASSETQLLARQFGIPFTSAITPHFLLIHNSDPAWVGRIGAILEQTHDQFYGRFRDAGFELRPVQGRLAWLCFSDPRQFDRYAREADGMDMSWLEGYYSSRTNRVAVVRSSPARALSAPAPAKWENAALKPSAQGYAAPTSASEPAVNVDEDIAKATHEAAHQLAFNSGLQTRGVMYPVWVSEGLATQFEGVTGEEIRQNRQARADRLLQVQAQNSLIPVSEFVAQTTVSGGARAKEEYAQAWGFFAFLMERRPESLNRYLQALAQLPPGRRDAATLRREFVMAFGSLPEIEDAWRQYLRDLAAPTLSLREAR